MSYPFQQQQQQPGQQYPQQSYGQQYPQQPGFSQQPVDQQQTGQQFGQQFTQQPGQQFTQQPGQQFTQQPGQQFGPGQSRQVIWLQQYGSYAPTSARDWFDSIDNDKNGIIDAKEVHQGLEMAGEDTSPKMVKHMVRLFNIEYHSGTLNYREFCELLGFLQKSKEIFNSYSMPFLDHPRALSGMKQLFPFLTAQESHSIFQKLVSKVDKHGKGFDYRRFLKTTLMIGYMQTSFEQGGQQQGGQYGQPQGGQYGQPQGGQGGQYGQGQMPVGQPTGQSSSQLLSHFESFVHQNQFKIPSKGNVY